MLSIEQKSLFLEDIIRLRKALDELETKNTLQELERFENQLTLDKLEDCLFDRSSEQHCKTTLITFLAQRWERIRGTSMCYTCKPANIVNQLCLKLATALSPPIIATSSEIEAFELNKGPYCLLMPSLENSKDVYGDDIHSLGFHAFVLSDEERAFIPLVSCLHEASISDTGQLRHVVMIDQQFPALTTSEIERVSKHSKQAAKLHQSILALNKRKLLSDGIGAKLSQLAVALREGGANSGNGAELNAGNEANLGILNFHNYWQALPEAKKDAIFAETPALRDIIGRLFRPEDVNYKETRFCVELLANALDPIIARYHNKPSIQLLQKKVEAQENALKAVLEKPHGLVIAPNSQPPRHILHCIFKLSPAQQGKIFKYSGYRNALMYALAFEPEALLEFELDEKSKKEAVRVKLKPNHDSALITASKLGSVSAIRLLLSWGADIQLPDVSGLTALHWAARNADMHTVECLLENDAQLETLTHRKNTPLNVAVMSGQRAVVGLLLKKSNLNARNVNGKNALDIALECHPELVEPILMEMATRPITEQAECLRNAPGGPYPHVFFYAATTTQLVKALFDLLNKSNLDPKMQAIHEHIYQISLHYQKMIKNLPITQIIKPLFLQPELF